MSKSDLVDLETILRNGNRAIVAWLPQLAIEIEHVLVSIAPASLVVLAFYGQRRLEPANRRPRGRERPAGDPGSTQRYAGEGPKRSGYRQRNVAINATYSKPKAPDASNYELDHITPIDLGGAPDR